MSSFTNCRLSVDNVKFLRKLNVNRIKADMSNEIESNSYMMDLIVKYFKVNNDKYLELVKMEDKRNV